MTTQVYGTFLVVASAMTCAMVAFIVKQLPLSTSLAAEARFFVCWVIALAFMLRYRSERGLQWFGPPKLRWGLVLRGFLTCSFVRLWWAALQMVPLGDCIAVVYCYPLLTVIWSRLMLGEKVLAVFPIQALLAAAGVCFIVQPPFLLTALHMAPAVTSDGGESRDYSLVVIAMIVSSIMPIVTRRTKEASWIEMEHVTNFLAVFVLNPITFCAQKFAKGEALLDLPSISAWDVGLIVLAASGSFAGVAMQTRGYQLAEPGKAGMFAYLEIPFAYFLQVLGTNSPLSVSSIIGAILVILACLLGAVAELRGAAAELRSSRTPVPEVVTGGLTQCELQLVECEAQSCNTSDYDTPFVFESNVHESGIAKICGA